jgi:indolepyruvate ferredoxin oxidoreductase beta subunit
MNDPARPITLLVCALGGEGGGVLAEWLVDVARHCGHAAQSTSIPGVAQRTGATTYYLEFLAVPDGTLNGRKPVFGLNPVPGAIDLLVSSELLETVRQIGNGMADAARTHIVSSSQRVLTTAEKMQPGDGRSAAQAQLQVLQRYARESQVFDMAAMAQRNGTAISAVLLGAVAGSGALPFPREAFEHVIREAGLGVQASLRGFAAAYEQVKAARDTQGVVQTALAPEPAASPFGADGHFAPDLAPTVLQAFPPATHQMLCAGHARVREYQDDAYAGLYVERLRRVVDAERAVDPAGAHAYAASRETARHLALWMAFDDIVRVADLKCRASRMQRVRGEVKADSEELLRLYDHFKPGVPELAALLPEGIADRLLRWDRGRRARGHAPLALPLKIATHSVSGVLALRGLAAMKGLRRRGSRYAAEQAMIERWLAALEAGLREDWRLGAEIAECARLIKGYGATNERGKDNLLYVLEHLAGADRIGSAPQRAEAIRAARLAALADDAGKALDKALSQHGVPARPIKPQPVQWVRQRPGQARRKATKP